MHHSHPPRGLVITPFSVHTGRCGVHDITADDEQRNSKGVWNLYLCDEGQCAPAAPRGVANVHNVGSSVAKIILSFNYLICLVVFSLVNKRVRTFNDVRACVAKMNLER